MMWKTHFLAGAASGMLLGGHADIKTAAMSAGIAGVAALLPDADSPHSKVGRLLPGVSWALNKTVGHRGPLHSLVGAAAAGLLTFAGLKVFGGRCPVAPLAVAAGYLSHLAVDSLNPQGVPWLWPLPPHFGLPLVRTDGLLERWAVLPAVAALCCWLAWGLAR